MNQFKEYLIFNIMQSIIYISGGALGDFIHQLSVICEVYLKTGKKGILYISHTARNTDKFPFGLEQAYKDTYKLITDQYYIESYHIHNNEPFDVNLSSWIVNQKLFINNYNTIYLAEYGVTFCNNKYLDIEYDSKYKDCIFISSSIKRFNSSIDYNKLIESLPCRPIFVTSTISEYEYFKNTTGIHLEYICFDKLYDLYIAINSCKLFIGNLSSPLTIAQGVMKPRIYILNSNYNDNDNMHMNELDKKWENCLFVYNTCDLIKVSEFYNNVFNQDKHVINTASFKSQFNQDKHVINVYNGKKNGFFVEIGAYDGIDSSNTYVLEKEYNWSGLCVECNPRHYATLSNTRNCHISNNAVYNVDGNEMQFYDSGGYAGLVETNNHTHITNDPIITVTTKKFTTLLDEINAPSFIEYLSLDTEGSEFKILEAHDFDKYKFGYICVEHNSINENRIKIRQLLESKGYIFSRENGNAQWGVIDDEYILSDL